MKLWKETIGSSSLSILKLKFDYCLAINTPTDLHVSKMKSSLLSFENISPPT